MKNESQLRDEIESRLFYAVPVFIKKEDLKIAVNSILDFLSSHDQELMRELKEKVEKLRTLYIRLRRRRTLNNLKQPEYSYTSALSDVLELFNQKEV